MRWMTSDFYCTKCGRKGIPIIRQGNCFREPGHLKKLFCIYCQKEVNHCEVRQIGQYTYQDFKFEYDHNNFNELGERKQTLKKLQQEVLYNE